MSEPSIPLEIDEDWEEWDGRSPFWAHCVAGSMAGVMEHAAIYPLDTVRTHIQVCASCVADKKSPRTLKHTGMSHRSSSLLRSALKPQQHQPLPLGMWQTIRFLMSEPAVMETPTAARTAASGTPKPFRIAGLTRLFRGVQTMFIGCIPAHALYFSSYETVKAAFTVEGHVRTTGSSLAGAAAVMSHDLVMTPLDTMKQRMQLGHYRAGVLPALHEILRQEGWRALYRSFPVTLATNVPYGMIMVATNEACKQAWTEGGTPASTFTVLAASSMGGFTAAAVTTPLDRIKTALQTQHIGPACAVDPAKLCPAHVKHAHWRDAAVSIWKEEGAMGFFRGVLPRVLSHTPAVAISWTTYETAKSYLLHYHHDASRW